LPGPTLPPETTLVASTTAAGWSNLDGYVVEGRLAEFYHHSTPDPTVAFHLNGVTSVEWKRSRRFTRFVSEPGALTIVPPGSENAFRTDRPSRWLVWAIDQQWLQLLAEQEWKTRGVRLEIIEAFNNRGAELWTLGQRLAAQICAPVAGSRLYVEALKTQIAVHLLWNHSSLTCREPEPASRLNDVRLRRVVDFIHASLGNEISLAELAEVAELSPSYFLSVFKEATGKTPHRYLTEQRVAKACELLRSPHCSVVDVSLAVGFSSQSHLTTVFRRFMKTTPSAYREEVLGMRSPGRGPVCSQSGRAAQHRLDRKNKERG
jgi:AraC family transcriptional regulator